MKLPDSEQTIILRCVKPVKFTVLLSTVTRTVSLDACNLEYNKDGKMCMLQTQEHLEDYLRVPVVRRPPLCVTVISKGANSTKS